MGFILLYCAFSCIFVVGCAAYELPNKKKDFNFPYLLGMVLAPIALPFIFGYDLSSRNHN